ncbi:hypothetical protein AwDysgo_03610 [Bacteroidales bacterium]|nr:hypothetical protein AwDysgo_03610 [Bacteroidales bacterium]
MEVVPVTVIFIGLMVFAAHLFSAIFDKKKIPDVLLLIFIGLLLGPIFNIVDPSSFAVGGSVFSTVTLVIILFEGGASISLNALKTSLRGAVPLIFASFFISTAAIGLISWGFYGFSPVSAFMLGAILAGTSSAVVIPLVRQIKMSDNVRTSMILESAITDVLAIVLTLALLEAYKEGTLNIGQITGSILASFLLAFIIGGAGAIAWSGVLNRIRSIKNSLFTTPAIVFVLYGISESLGYSGAITALAFGITIANIELIPFSILKKIHVKDSTKLNTSELTFFSELVFLLKTFFFIYIGMSIVLGDAKSFFWGFILIVAIYAVRLIIAKFLSPPSATNHEKSIISIMIPKGLASAVLAGIPLQAGVLEGEMIKNITFSVILMTIVITSSMVLIFEKSPRFNLFYRKFFSSSLAIGKYFSKKKKDTDHEIVEDSDEIEEDKDKRGL